MRISRNALFGLLLGASSFIDAGAASSSVQTKYRGFTIDETQIRGSGDLAAIRAATEQQIDIVCSVRLPPEMLKFFQGVPFELVQTSVLPNTPGAYSGRTSKAVRVTARIVSIGPKPVLLHELIHAYHDQQVKGGFKNPEIIAFFTEGRKTSAYAANSHMLANPQEFFACAATTYLYAVTAQEPFERSKIKANQPVFFAFLQKLFGPNAGQFEGSLTKPPPKE